MQLTSPLFNRKFFIDLIDFRLNLLSRNDTVFETIFSTVLFAFIHAGGMLLTLFTTSSMIKT